MKSLWLIGCWVSAVVCSGELFAQPDIRRKGTKETKTEQVQEPVIKEKSLWQVSGKVLDENKEPLAGVYIVVDGTLNGTLTNAEGNFTLTLNEKQPIKIRFSYIGYATQFLDIQPDNISDISIQMKEEVIQANEVVISASRIQERITESPVSIEKMDIITVREAPAMNAYEGLTILKGIDQLGGSMLFKVFNTRGFNSATNLRFVQRLDGMDMQAPGLNFSLGILNGASDIDIESIEIIPGVASALYGPNAFNGLLNVYTKNPWQYQGLSASLKLGANHLDSFEPNTQPLYDLNIRYAKAFNEKWAFKTTLGYIKATDWYANDTRDVANYAGTANPNLSELPGFDGLNLYGDEVSAIFDSASTGGMLNQPIRIARTGYHEKDLVDYNTYNFKADASLHFKPNAKMELILQGRWNAGSTLYQAVNKIAIKDFFYQLYRAELKGDNFYVRTYGSIEDAGKTYDTRFAAINLNRMVKPDEQWFTQYLLVYGNNNFLINAIRGFAGQAPLAAGSDAVARAFADGDQTETIRILEQNQDPFYLANRDFVNYIFGGKGRLQPGTPEFKQAFQDIISKPGFLDGGALFVDKTGMIFSEAQYDFKNQISFMELIAGGNVRYFKLNSQGTLFSDTAGNPLNVWEVGAFVQASKKFMEDRLKVILSARVDKSKNFNPVFSPRFSAVYSLGAEKNHHFRISGQTGFRNPSLQSQYINLDLGVSKYIGSVKEAYEPYGIENNYSQASVNAFLTEYQRQLDAGQDTATAIAQATPLLEKLNIKPSRPEQIQTLEVGYKTLLNQKLYIDAYAYFSWYNYFEGAVDLVAPARQWNEQTKSYQFLPFSPEVIANNSAPKAYYRRFYNLEEQVRAWGGAIGATYAFNHKYSLQVSYNYNKALFDENSASKTIAAYNTPEHKTTASFSARNLWKHFGFTITHRWQDAFLLEESYAQGIVPAFNTIDFQASYKITQFKTTFRIGATNVLNQRRVEMLGGGAIGILPYFQITYDELF